MGNRSDLVSSLSKNSSWNICVKVLSILFAVGKKTVGALPPSTGLECVQQCYLCVKTENWKD